MAKPGQPSRKLFIKDLKTFKPLPGSAEGVGKEWINPISETGMQPVKFVWLQGVVIQCDSPDIFMLDDGSGIALVGGCTKIPAACPKPKLGGYFMVIGELKANVDMSAVKAFKIQDLSDCETLRQMWPLEVMDMECH